MGEEKGGGCPARHATAATGSPGLTLRALAEGSGGEGMAGKAACKPETAAEKELKRATEGSPEASRHLQRRCRQNEHEPAGLKESDGRGRRMRRAGRQAAMVQRAALGRSSNHLAVINRLLSSCGPSDLGPTSV